MASLRASVTFALRMHRRLATSMAQRLSVLNLVARVSSALAASCKTVRTPASPTRVIAPVMSVRQISLAELGQYAGAGIRGAGATHSRGGVARPR